MLNPKDTSCTLYPEEIAALLKTGKLASFSKIDAEDSANATIYVPETVPEWLKEALQEFLPTVPTIERAYMAGIQWAGPPTSQSLQ